jgi:transketolase
MLGAAAGLATTGLVPYVCTFACFSAIMGYENIRTDLAYPKLPVRVLGTHAGISMGLFGTSHHATEDIAALRAVANLMVVSPCDPVSTEALLRATVDHDGPVYFRIGRGRDGTVYRNTTELRPGRPTVLARGADVLIVATGAMVQESLAAAQILAERGIGASVVDVHTLRPFPGIALAELAAAHGAVLTVEEHNIEDGLGTMTVEALAAAGIGTPLHKHGLRDEYALIGPPSHLYRYYGLDSAGVATVAQRLHEHPGTTPLAADPLWTDVDRRGVYARYGVPR